MWRWSGKCSGRMAAIVRGTVCGTIDCVQLYCTVSSACLGITEPNVCNRGSRHGAAQLGHDRSRRSLDSTTFASKVTRVCRAIATAVIDISHGTLPGTPRVSSALVERRLSPASCATLISCHKGAYDYLIVMGGF